MLVFLRMSIYVRYTSDTGQYHLPRAKLGVTASLANAWNPGYSLMRQNIILEWCGMRKG